MRKSTVNRSTITSMNSNAPTLAQDNSEERVLRQPLLTFNHTKNRKTADSPRGWECENQVVKKQTPFQRGFFARVSHLRIFRRSFGVCDWSELNA